MQHAACHKPHVASQAVQVPPPRTCAYASSECAPDSWITRGMPVGRHIPVCNPALQATGWSLLRCRPLASPLILIATVGSRMLQRHLLDAAGAAIAAVTAAAPADAAAGLAATSYTIIFVSYLPV